MNEQTDFLNGFYKMKSSNRDLRNIGFSPITFSPRSRAQLFTTHMGLHLISKEDHRQPRWKSKVLYECLVGCKELCIPRIGKGRYCVKVKRVYFYWWAELKIVVSFTLLMSVPALLHSRLVRIQDILQLILTKKKEDFL